MTNPSKRIHVGEYCEHRGVFMPGNLLDAIDWLQGILESVPEKYRQDVRISIDSESEYDYHYPVIRLWYFRPETADEKRERENVEKCRLEEEAAYLTVQAKNIEKRLSEIRE